MISPAASTASGSNALFNLFHVGSFFGRRRRRSSFSTFLFQTNTNPIRRFHSSTICSSSQQTTDSTEQLLVVVGGGAAGVYAAIRAKNIAPQLGVLIVEKGKFLSKVRVSGGGRCNVTNGHYVDKMVLAEHYPRGNKELRGSFFSMHSPLDTMSWFSDHGVELKTEDDGRVFPVSNNSSSVIDCLLVEAKRSGVLLQAGKVVTNASRTNSGKFCLKIEKRTIDFVEYVEADYLLIATGSSQQGYTIAGQLGHSIIDPIPSLFTFKVEDRQLADLSGVTFPKVKAKLKLQNVCRNIPQFVQVGPMLVTHWGLSGPVILRLSAWGARDLFGSDYTGMLLVDFVPDLPMEEVKYILIKHKDQLGKQKVLSSFPPQFGLVKRFWKYLLQREDIDGNIVWASISNNSLNSIALLLKQCSFTLAGKGQFKEEFVTAGGVPLSEISLNTMESKIQSHLFFAGEVLNVDGVTGGFNFQNAWSGGYIAGTSIGKLALGVCVKEEGNLESRKQQMKAFLAWRLHRILNLETICIKIY
ncbi:HI0933_like domain-containing protein [Cinnamomum micranthum f. kanehirae]|uniref:HI0933_like domain-containing protein n=1 Tax=Cinnamomum micranthum f. kanehirae TaxID=337451 RepID=A0A443N286_9MAGN|nr:HI0933_like domain-containing protein [Cinnamomum micranthum f. kanehirae]